MSLADDALDFLAAGAKGGAAGAALGPVGAAIGVAMGVAPSVAKWLGVDQDTTQKAVQIVQRVTGTADPMQQRAVLGTDPGLEDDLHVQLVQLANERAAEENRALEARIAAAAADTASARQQTVQLAQAGSKLAWGAPVMSGIVLLAFAIMTYVVVSHSIPAGSEQIALVMLGTLGALATACVQYWVGSSAGSARKDDRLANMVPVPPSPGVIVPAADVQPAR